MKRPISQQDEYNVLGLTPAEAERAAEIDRERAPFADAPIVRQPRKFTLESLRPTTAYDDVIAMASAKTRPQHKSCNHGGGQS